MAVTIQRNYLKSLVADLKSDAEIIWLYNRFIQDGLIPSRPVGSPSVKERQRMMISYFHSYADETPQAIEAKNWIEKTIANYPIEGLVDSDISWLRAISSEDVFSCWYYVRIAQLGQNPVGLPRVWVSDKQTIDAIHEDATPQFSHYSYLWLPEMPASKSEILESLIDFLCCWTPDRNAKRSFTHELAMFVKNLPTSSHLEFTKNCSKNELDFIWAQLRKKYKMIGAACDKMPAHGYARLYGVFSNWKTPDQNKLEVIESLKKDLSHHRSKKTPSKSARLNLTVDAAAREKLVECAGGERRMSKFVEDWINSL